MALLRKHSSATKEDVKQVAVSAVGGRIKPSPESKFYDEPFALIDEIAGEILG
jgi:hypothetical protein